MLWKKSMISDIFEEKKIDFLPFKLAYFNFIINIEKLTNQLPDTVKNVK